MKIAINVSPLQTGHRKRGIGYYTKHLTDALREDPKIDLLEFTKPSEVKRADVTHYPWFDFFFHTLPIRKKFPTVVTIHDVIPLIYPKHYPKGIKGRINLALQKVALKGCKYIITDSRAAKEDIKKYLKVEDKKVIVVPLAADPKFRAINNNTKLLLIKRQYHLPDRFLLYVGDANWVKNLPFLIEAFKELLHISGLQDVKLVLVGGVFLKDVENINHPELESLKLVNRLIKQYGLESNIIRPGQLADDTLVAFYNLATIYVQPSLYEGFGLPILEAFSCGTPVISSNKGSLPEVGGEAALYFDPTSIKQFLSVTEEILKDISLQNKISKMGAVWVGRFSWDKVIEETKSVYRKALEKNE